MFLIQRVRCQHKALAVKSNYKGCPLFFSFLCPAARMQGIYRVKLY